MIKLFNYVLFEEAIVGISPLLSMCAGSQEVLFVEIYLGSGQTIKINLIAISSYLPTNTEKEFWVEKFTQYTQERDEFLLKHYGIGGEENA